MSRDHSLPEDYEADAPLLSRLQSWRQGVEKSYGWYEISDNAAAALLNDLIAAIAAIEAGLSTAVDE